MDILKILEESGKELYTEDLDFFETELATGDSYDEAYRKQCHALIREIRAWHRNEAYSHCMPADAPAPAVPEPNGIVIDIWNAAPKEDNPAATSAAPEKVIFHDVSVMREKPSYKTQFKKYVSQKSEIDAAFVDMHYAFFRPWELDAIISEKQMGEDFLEKYFGALDHDTIARYQQFSEGFFIRHFSQMDATIVLAHGKNEWRKKENRSKQLDVFLRLKGVKI